MTDRFLMKQRSIGEESDHDHEIGKENENEPSETLYGFLSKNRDYEKEIKNLLEEINNLMEKETNRIYSIYSTMTLDEKTVQKLKNILKSLFGLKESEKKYEAFLKFIHENKNSKNTKNNSQQKKMLENVKMKNKNIRNRIKTEIDTTFSNRFQKDLYLNLDKNIVNYNYNVSYNYHPKFQNSSNESTYYNNFLYE